MGGQASHTIRKSHSGVPAFASALVGAVFFAGAGAFASLESRMPAAERDDIAPVERITDYATGITVSEPVPAALTELTPARPVETAAVIPVDAMSVTDPDIAAAVFEKAEVGARVSIEPVISGPVIALVIDDVGLDRAASDRVIGLEAPLTIAVLPYAPASVSVAGDAVAQGHDVLVHMPMEPLGLADPGPNALLIGQSEADIAARIRWSLARVPGAIGINNHMGSRFTQDAAAMRTALSSLPPESGLFLDSVTIGGSRGYDTASNLGLTALKRDIFLDHVIAREAIDDRLSDVEAVAHRQGWAIAIGHPHAETLDALEAWIAGAQARGFRFVRLSEIEPVTIVEDIEYAALSDAGSGAASGLD